VCGRDDPAAVGSEADRDSGSGCGYGEGLPRTAGIDKRDGNAVAASSVNGAESSCNSAALIEADDSLYQQGQPQRAAVLIVGDDQARKGCCKIIGRIDL